MLAVIDNTSQNDDYPSESVLYGVICLTIFIGFVTSILVALDIFTTTPSMVIQKAQFHVLFDYNISKVFKRQTKETLETLELGVTTVMGPHCERPSVLMLIATSEAYTTAIVIAKKLVQTVIVSMQSELVVDQIKKAVMRGSKYSSFDDYWKFHRGLSKRMSKYKAVIITEFQTVHPQVATVLCTLADDTFSPFPKSVVILVADADHYFSHKDLSLKPAVNLAEYFVAQIMGGFLDSDVVSELQRVCCGRPAIIQRDINLDLA